MEAVQQRKPPAQGLKRFLATRRGAWVIAFICATLGALALVVFVNQYKSNVNADLASTPVLTADRLIPRGTAGNVVVTEKLFKPGALADQDIKLGAVADANQLVGKVATRDILPGQQITAADFAAEADPIRSRITKNERALQIPLSGPQAIQGVVRGGDRVDIMVMLQGGEGAQSGAGARYLMRDVRVMSLTESAVMLEVTDRQAAQLAFAADNAKLWFVLRPPVGAQDSKSAPVTSSSLLLGARPIETGATTADNTDSTATTAPAEEATP
jgi:Flp pilus assembly protein CpaB